MGGLEVLLIILLAMAAMCLYMLYRNNCIANYRGDLIKKISELNQKDISAGKSWTWRWVEYGRISYNEMLLKFWKPLNSFYPDKSFIMENQEE